MTLVVLSYALLLAGFVLAGTVVTAGLVGLALTASSNRPRRHISAPVR